MVWRDIPKDRDYFRIGMPLKTIEKPVERNQRIVWDEMATTVGWSKVSAMEDGEPVGEMKSDKYQFYCSDFGTEREKDGTVQRSKRVYLVVQYKILLCKPMLLVRVRKSMKWDELR